MGRLLQDLHNGSVATRGLAQRTAGGVVRTSVQQASVAGAHRGLNGPCTTKTKAALHGRTHLQAVQGPCGNTVFSEPHVVDIRTVELTKPRGRFPRAFLLKIEQEVGAQAVIPALELMSPLWWA